jgi:hypothetical protein
MSDLTWTSAGKDCWTVKYKGWRIVMVRRPNCYVAETGDYSVTRRYRYEVQSAVKDYINGRILGIDDEPAAATRRR